MNDERDETQEAEVPADAEETPAQEEPKLCQVSVEELQKILKEHTKWLDSGGEEGTRADLSRANLQGANLQKANLKEANLQEANLQGADLWYANLQEAFLRRANLQDANLQGADLQEATLWDANLQGAKLKEAKLQGANLQDANLQGARLWQADLQGANLQEANLQGADLYEAKLQEADLQDANLTDARGLLGKQLAGANVSGAKLPEDIHEFEGLKTLEEASRNARKIFQVMLIACAYSLLTIFSTKDAALLTNSSSSPLPIIQTGVPIAGFFVVAPIILFAAYLYFHIYLQRLWEGLADLPAIFPDGRPLDKRAYPWLLNGLVRSHFKLLRSERPPLSRLQAFVSILLAWCTVPAMLFLFWGRYLPRHHWWGTGSNIALLAASIGFGIFSYRLTRRTLRGEDWGQLPDWKQAWKDVRIYSGAAALGSVVIFFVISLAAISGVGLSVVANLRDAEVSIKPQNWTGQKEKEKEEIALVKGAQLKDADLRRANAHGAFLVNADLREAKLQNTDLSNADLRGADLQGANLPGAKLQGAKLQKAKLWGANLQGAYLKWAKLQGASLRGAKLQGAVLQGANLKGAYLGGANLQEANLKWANLKGAKLWRAKLQEANLQKADLRGAILQKAYLKEANLREANLKGADLRRVENLTVSQLKAARNWDLAFYDDDFLKKHGKELGLPQSEKEHTENVENKLAKLEQ